MARPLGKCRPDGTPYTRFPDVEAAIDAAMALDAETRIARAELLDKSAAGFLSKEALVCLIRDAKRSDDQTTLAKLFTILVHRCEKVLMSQVPDSHRHASDIRTDTLAELGELIATDEKGTDPNRLDFFEVRFDSAFARLRSSVRRKYRRHGQHETIVAEPDDPTRSLAEGALEVHGEQEPILLSKERMALFNRLPEDDRKLLLLRFVNEIKVESTDPNEPTLAKIYRVEGRTIRNRLKAACTRLTELEKSHDD